MIKILTLHVNFIPKRLPLGVHELTGGIFIAARRCVSSHVNIGVQSLLIEWLNQSMLRDLEIS